jgi:hypothetical protein
MAGESSGNQKVNMHFAIKRRELSVIMKRTWAKMYISLKQHHYTMSFLCSCETSHPGTVKGIFCYKSFYLNIQEQDNQTDMCNSF